MTEGESIVQLMHLYAFAIDAKQMQLFDQIFTPDVEADYTGRHWNDRASWREDFEASHQPFDVTQHLVLNGQLARLGRYRPCLLAKPLSSDPSGLPRWRHG